MMKNREPAELGRCCGGGEHTADVLLRVELLLELVTRAAHAGAGGVAALIMKPGITRCYRAVVEAFLREEDEAVDVAAASSGQNSTEIELRRCRWSRCIFGRIIAIAGARNTAWPFLRSP